MEHKDYNQHYIDYLAVVYLREKFHKYLDKLLEAHLEYGVDTKTIKDCKLRYSSGPFVGFPPEGVSTKLKDGKQQ